MERVTGGNNSAVEVVSWRQKIETWLWSKLWAIEHRLLRMISLYRLYFTALATGSAILASTFSSMLDNAYSPEPLSALCALVIVTFCRFQIRTAFCGSSNLVNYLTQSFHLS
jgi:hypothetical protein